MVLLILGCCFVVQRVIGGNNKSVKLYNALKCLNYILAFKCIYSVIDILSIYLMI